MRPHVEAMWAERDRLVQAVARAVTTQVPGYAATPSSEVWIGMTRILERAVLGDPFSAPTEEDRQAAFGTGIQGAGAGIPPEDLVAAILLGAREVETAVLDRARDNGVSAEDRLEASGRARRWAEQVAVWGAQALVSAGQEAGAEHNAGQRLVEQRLVTALQDGTPAATVRESAAQLALDLGRPWCAVVALGVGTGVGTGDAAVPATTLRLSSRGGVWAVADTVTTGLLPAPPRPVAGLAVGLAGPVPWDDLGAALGQAHRAAAAARRFGLEGVHSLADLGLLVPLHEDPALGDRLVARWLAPLAAEPRHDLVATVRHWVDHDGQVEPVARALGVHPNTIRNRLDRVTALLGAGWRSPRHRAEIWAALQVSP